MIERIHWFVPVKSGEPVTWLEHAVHTYHVSRYIYEKLALDLDKGKYLYACFFHDAGKMLWRGFEDRHTPYTREALKKIAGEEKYRKLLEVFELPDFSEDEEVIRAIEKHHDADSILSLWIAAADHISSAEINPRGTIPLHAASFAGLDRINFYHVTLPTFSKNDYNRVGKLVLLKLIYECLQEMEQIDFLYETREGCRVATTLSPEQLRPLLGERMVEGIKTFIMEQDLYEWFRGYPSEAKTYAEMLPFTTDELIEIINEVKARELLESLKQKTKKEEIELNFCGLPDDFFDRLSKQDIREAGASINSIVKYGGYEEILGQIGISLNNVTHLEQVLTSAKTHTMAVNLVKNAENFIDFNLGNYIAIDGAQPVEELFPGEDDYRLICSNCGTYKGVVKATTLLLQVVQHGRESLFQGKNSSVRKNLSLCLPCYLETLFNMFLCGVVSKVPKTVRDFSHIVLFGFDITEAENLLDDDKLQHIQRMKVNKKSIYARGPQSLQVHLLSLPEFYIGNNDIYREFFFRWSTWDLFQDESLAVSISVNCLPRVLSPQTLQLSNKTLEPLDKSMHDWFDYILRDAGGTTDDRRDMVARFHKRPLLGISYLFRRRWPFIRYNEKLEEVVNQMVKGDIIYEIIDGIWEMARLSNKLETGKNVGAFLSAFKGRPEDVDRVANRMLKNPYLTKEKRFKIIELCSVLREKAATLSRKERGELTNRIQETKYLMNSRKFYENEKLKEESSDA